MKRRHIGGVSVISPSITFTCPVPIEGELIQYFPVVTDSPADGNPFPAEVGAVGMVFLPVFSPVERSETPGWG